MGEKKKYVWAFNMDTRMAAGIVVLGNEGGLTCQSNQYYTRVNYNPIDKVPLVSLVTLAHVWTTIKSSGQKLDTWKGAMWLSSVFSCSVASNISAAVNFPTKPVVLLLIDRFTLWIYFLFFLWCFVLYL